MWGVCLSEQSCVPVGTVRVGSEQWFDVAFSARLRCNFCSEDIHWFPCHFCTSAWVQNLFGRYNMPQWDTAANGWKDGNWVADKQKQNWLDCTFCSRYTINVEVSTGDSNLLCWYLYIHNGSWVSSERGWCRDVAEVRFFTPVCAKTRCLFQFIHISAVGLLMHSSSLLAGGSTWCLGNAGPAQHLCGLLEEMKIFHCRGEDFSSMACYCTWLSVLPKVNASKIGMVFRYLETTLCSCKV